MRAHRVRHLHYSATDTTTSTLNEEGFTGPQSSFANDADMSGRCSV